MTNKIEELRNTDMSLQNSQIEYPNDVFMEFIKTIDAKDSFHSISYLEEIVVCFEKNYDTKNILAIKLRDDHGFIVFSSKTRHKKGIPHTYTRLEHIEGKYGFEVAKLLAKHIVVFFKASFATEMPLDEDTSFVHICDFKTRKIKITKKQKEKTLSLIPETSSLN